MKKLVLAIFLLVITANVFGFITELHTESNDLPLTSIVTVLQDIPDASNPMLCQAYIVLGEGAKVLDATGGIFEFTMTIGGNTIQPSPELINFGTEATVGVWTAKFPVPANENVVIRVLSPNSADDDVTVTSYLYDVANYSVAGEPLASLVSIRLDHLMHVAANDADVGNDSVIAKMSTGGGTWSDFTPALDSLEVIGNRLLTHDSEIRTYGDDAWKTGTAAQTANTVDVDGGSTPAGGETGTEENTYLDNGVKWVIDDEGAGIDARLVFTLDTDKTANFITMNGYVDSHQSRPVDVYAWNYLTTSFDKLSDNGSRILNDSSDSDHGPYILLPAHQQAVDGEVIVRFANTSTTLGDDLYLDQVLVMAVGTGGFTLDEIGDAVAQHDVSNHTDHDSFGFRAAIGGMFEEFTITTSDTASSFTCSSLPTVTNNYQYHRVRLHDVSMDKEYGSWILSMNASGVIILGKPFVITPDVGDEIYIQGSMISVSQILADIAEGQGIGFVEATHSQVSTLERGNAAWLTGAGATPADMYTDTTTRPWEEVYHVIGDTETEYYREALYTAQGTPIVSAAMKVGQRIRQ